MDTKARVQMKRDAWAWRTATLYLKIWAVMAIAMALAGFGDW